ncbi:TolC family protein [Psychrosphaera sp. B3R10]|uniref:TolC family protein n=1 Tax=unclassified Psychrosphaera TaxID=2641570 RepID=UPI001C0868ED|nr:MULTISPECIES: TolC family protein [unclassified Psychrosphaera]MBU2883459.1 TolC family protein [Psychrosphaera sp. I2R16]MBU2988020.1 TolC family protein [Psychrosphaera sp. B3R10]
MKWIIIFPLVMFLTACASEPKHLEGDKLDNIDEAIPKDWRYSAKLLVTNSDLLWGIKIPDPILAKLLEVSDENISLKIARLRLRQAKLDFEISTGQLWPDASLAAGQRHSQSLVDDEKKFLDSSNIGLSVKWEVDLWDRLGDETKRTAWLAEAKSYDLVAATYSLQSQFLTTWFDLIEQKKLLELNKNNIENQNRRLQMSMYRLDNGLSSGIDIRNAKTNLFRLRESQKGLQYRLVEAKRRLNLMLGHYSESELDIDLTFPELETGVVFNKPRDILLNRPDVLAANANLLAAGFSWDAAKKRQLPKLTLNFDLDARRSKIEELFDFDFWLSSISASIVQPIFYRDVLSKQAKKLELSQEIALQQYRQTLLDAWREVESASQNELILRSRQSLLSRAFAEAKEAENQTEIQYTAGLANSFELLSAQRTRTSVETDLMKLATARLKNRVQLILALGIPNSEENKTKKFNSHVKN